MSTALKKTCCDVLELLRANPGKFRLPNCGASAINTPRRILPED
jgi:hypothetical protein